MANEKALRAAAKELNEVLGLDPAMNVKAPIAELTDKVMEALDLITEEDSFSAATQAVIDEFLAPEEPEEPAEEVEEVKPARKPVAKPAVAAAKPAGTAFQKKDYSRGHALVDALKKGGTKAELVVLVDEFYEEKGGTPNPKGAKAMLDIHLPILKLVGAVTEDKNGKIKLA